MLRAPRRDRVLAAETSHANSTRAGAGTDQDLHVKAQPLVVAEGRPKHGAVPPQQTTAEPKQHCRPELIPNDCHGKELRTTRLYAPCCSRHLQLGKAATQGSQGGGPQHKVG